jgi:hypothetical protein
MLNSEKCTFVLITKKIEKAKNATHNKMQKVHSAAVNSVLPIIVGV